MCSSCNTLVETHLSKLFIETPCNTSKHWKHIRATVFIGCNTLVETHSSNSINVFQLQHIGRNTFIEIIYWNTLQHLQTSLEVLHFVATKNGLAFSGNVLGCKMHAKHSRNVFDQCLHGTFRGIIFSGNKPTTSTSTSGNGETFQLSYSNMLVEICFRSPSCNCAQAWSRLERNVCKARA